MALPFGINVIGYVSSNVSLGITARQFIKLFQEIGVPVAVHDIDFGRSETGRDFDFQSLVVPEGSELPYSINMFFIALYQLPQWLLKSSPNIFSGERLNVGLLWYEVTSIPNHHAEALSLLDVLACGSGFVKHIFDTNVRNTLTIECKHPMHLPSDAVPSQEKFSRTYLRVTQKVLNTKPAQMSSVISQAAMASTNISRSNLLHNWYWRQRATLNEFMKVINHIQFWRCRRRIK